ncbi:DUF4834 family protein [Chitinophaga horti]|uniref:DUF4834 family protein n=1 Tax=Chitinophaga horti TaxID=2920382 RepID=A0ABY6IZ81_9BACT|nr:DUF4834 family protein [Chitinophaga horti]UYQ92718.1 DUF4834 family protein [Chitinophaga horti]
MLKFLFYLFLFWLIYKLVFDFIIPVYRTTKHVKRQMNDVQEHMREQFRQQQQQSSGYSTPNPNAQTAEKVRKAPDSDDYIDFEEIK